MVKEKKVRGHKAFEMHFARLCSSGDHVAECAQIKSLMEAKKRAQNGGFNNNAAAAENNNATLTAPVPVVLATPAAAPAAAQALAVPSDASLSMIESVSRIATQTCNALEELWDQAGMPPDERERMYSQLVSDIQKLCDLKVQRGGQAWRHTPHSTQDSCDTKRKEDEKSDDEGKVSFFLFRYAAILEICVCLLFTLTTPPLCHLHRFHHCGHSRF